MQSRLGSVRGAVVIKQIKIKTGVGLEGRRDLMGLL